MASQGDIETDLTLELNGANVSPEKFVRGVRAFFALVKELAKDNAVPGALPPEWNVTVKKASRLIALEPQPGFDPAVVERVLALLPDGLSKLEENATTIPRGFSERSLRRAKELSEVVGDDDRDDTTVRLWIKKRPQPISPRTSASVATILGEAEADHGSVEGRLQVVSEKGGYRVTLTEPLWNKPIRCTVDEDLLKEALTLFGQRVEAYGMIRYRADGTILSIAVEEFVRFPDAAQIPSFHAVRGVLRAAAQ